MGEDLRSLIKKIFHTNKKSNKKSIKEIKGNSDSDSAELKTVFEKYTPESYYISDKKPIPSISESRSSIDVNEKFIPSIVKKDKFISSIAVIENTKNNRALEISHIIPAPSLLIKRYNMLEQGNIRRNKVEDQKVSESFKNIDIDAKVEQINIGNSKKERDNMKKNLGDSTVITAGKNTKPKAFNSMLLLNESPINKGSSVVDIQNEFTKKSKNKKVSQEDLKRSIIEELKGHIALKNSLNKTRSNETIVTVNNDKKYGIAAVKNKELLECNTLKSVGQISQNALKNSLNKTRSNETIVTVNNDKKYGIAAVKNKELLECNTLKSVGQISQNALKNSLNKTRSNETIVTVNNDKKYGIAAVKNKELLECNTLKSVGQVSQNALKNSLNKTRSNETIVTVNNDKKYGIAAVKNKELLECNALKSVGQISQNAFKNSLNKTRSNETIVTVNNDKKYGIAAVKNKELLECNTLKSVGQVSQNAFKNSFNKTRSNEPIAVVSNYKNGMSTQYPLENTIRNENTITVSNNRINSNIQCIIRLLSDKQDNTLRPEPYPSYSGSDKEDFWGCMGGNVRNKKLLINNNTYESNKVKNIVGTLVEKSLYGDSHKHLAGKYCKNIFSCGEENKFKIGLYQRKDKGIRHSLAPVKDIIHIK